MGRVKQSARSRTAPRVNRTEVKPHRGHAWTRKKKGSRVADAHERRNSSSSNETKVDDDFAVKPDIGVEDPDTNEDKETLALRASAHWSTYHEHGRMHDLEEAIRLDRLSLETQARRGEPRDPETVVNLGVSLLDMFLRVTKAETLDESVSLFEQAMQMMTSGHPALPRTKVNLGNAYRARAELRGNDVDLDRAIDLYEDALLETPSDHSTWDLEIRQNCLARSLMARGTQRDVERAMDLMSFRRAHKEEFALARPMIRSIGYSSVYDADIGIPVPDLTDLVIKLTAFPSGCGGFADIYMGEWIKTRRLKQRVAIKALRRHTLNVMGTQDVNERVNKMLKAEIRIWHRLSHPNVIKLIGTCRGFGPFTSMICPWFANGSLPSYLQRHKSLIYSERLRLIREVAVGLYYLHSNGIIHGDLTGANILINDDQSACLSDFGLSVLARDFDLPSMSSFSSGIGGSVRWAAPELYAFGDSVPCVTVYSDIYSFGSVALEIMSGEIPYYYVQHEMEVLLKYVVPGVRPERPKGSRAVQDGHWEAVEKCWSLNTHARPTSKILSSMFEE